MDDRRSRRGTGDLDDDRVVHGVTGDVGADDHDGGRPGSPWASSSPRIVQTFLRDRPSQHAIGLFVATFTHAMLSMREVQFDGEGQVPGIAIGVAYVLVLVSITMLVLYVDHIGRSLRVSSLIELVGDDTRCLLDAQYPDTLPVDDVPPSVILASSSGVVTLIDRTALVDMAVSADCILHVVPAVGSFVPAGAPLIHIEGHVDRLDRGSTERCVELGLERTLDEDVAYGFRMLVDVAERSLSESPFLDPTTAVQSIDRLHDALRQLAVRVIPDGRWYGNAGVLRLTVPTMDWDAYVHLAFRRDSPGRRRVAASDSTTVRSTDRPRRARSARAPAGPGRTARTPARSRLQTPP